MSAPLIENDYQRGIQYFRADFPTFWAGDYVEYVPVLSCAGRRAPDPATAHTFPSSFRLDPMPPLVRATTPPAAANPQPTFQARLEHLVSVNVQLARQPELIGQTPAGYVVNWPPIEGALDGPAFHARIVPGGDHETIVRPDGIGILRVRVSVETDDHALISLEYSGAVEYGENWTEWLRAGRWPEALAVRSGIRMLTSASRYNWLNRLQCIGVGEVYPRELSYRYDMYAVR
jgi:hypothetical protein